MSINQALENIQHYITDPTQGLPEEVFLFLTELTPMLNVDLLIKNKQEQILLAWRDDEFCGTGWHIPGGIIRVKETFKTRIEKVAQKEIGCSLIYNSTPVAVNELIHPQKTRGRSEERRVGKECS